MHPYLAILEVANFWIQAAFTAAVSAYAITRGGDGPRGAAVVNLIGWSVGWAANYLMKLGGPQLLVICAADALVAAGFLYFAVRYNSLWLAVGVIAQGVQLALDYITLIEWHGLGLPARVLWNVALNGLTDVIQISVLGAAIAGRRRLALHGAVRV